MTEYILIIIKILDSHRHAWWGLKHVIELMHVIELKHVIELMHVIRLTN
jgi:hypothetical protein